MPNNKHVRAAGTATVNRKLKIVSREPQTVRCELRIVNCGNEPHVGENDMKVNPIANPNILSAYQPAKSLPAKTSVAAGRDEVTFSDEALSFAKIMSEVESRSQEERAHIANVSNAVRNGEYRVESDKIADKILESVLKR